MKYIVKLLFLIMMTLPAAVQAQTAQEAETSLYELYLNFNSGSSEARALKSAPNQDRAEKNFTGPDEPILPKVTFYEFDKPSHLEGRAESLVHGIVIGLPPEYDHYGYEMRRHMNSIGNFDIYINQAALEKERLNLEKAAVIFKYWRRKLDEDLAALGKEIENGQAGSKTLTTYRLNKGLIQTFLIETQGWINANKAYLDFIKESSGKFQFSRNKLIFPESSTKAIHLNLYAAKEKAKARMQQYDPFREIVY